MDPPGSKLLGIALLWVSIPRNLHCLHFLQNWKSSKYFKATLTANISKTIRDRITYKLLLESEWSCAIHLWRFIFWKNSKKTSYKGFTKILKKKSWNLSESVELNSFFFSILSLPSRFFCARMTENFITFKMRPLWHI